MAYLFRMVAMQLRRLITRLRQWVLNKRFPSEASLMDGIRANIKRGTEFYDALVIADGLVMGPWMRRSDSMVDDVLHSGDLQLFLHDSLRYAMIVEDSGKFMNRQLDYLMSRLPTHMLRWLLREPRIQGIPVNSERFECSHNNIHHLHHITLFEDYLNTSISNLNCIAEFGGGYGNMARLVRMMVPDVTYLIIDLPIFLLIQYAYLETVLGTGICNFIVRQDQSLKEGKINLMVSQSTYSQDYVFDMFISTLALSESTRMAQQAVFEAGFFGADYLLVSHQTRSERWKHAESFVEPINQQYDICFHGKLPYFDKDESYLIARKDENTYLRERSH